MVLYQVEYKFIILIIINPFFEKNYNVMLLCRWQQFEVYVYIFCFSIFTSSKNAS